MALGLFSFTKPIWQRVKNTTRHIINILMAKRISGWSSKHESNINTANNTTPTTITNVKKG